MDALMRLVRRGEGASRRTWKGVGMNTRRLRLGGDGFQHRLTGMFISHTWVVHMMLGLRRETTTQADWCEIENAMASTYLGHEANLPEMDQ